MAAVKNAFSLGVKGTLGHPFIVMLLLLSFPAYANPTPLFRASSEYYLSIIALLIEYLAIRFLFKSFLKIQQAMWIFIFVNALNFPVTLIYSLLAYLTIGMPWFAEIIPLIAEPAFYYVYLKEKRIMVPRVWSRVIAANLISFTAGMILYYGNSLVYESSTFWIWYIGIFGSTMYHAPYQLVAPITHCFVIIIVIMVLCKKSRSS